jgi:hypothetical protein
MTQSTTTTGGRDVMDVRPGLPAPMGSTPDVGGTNFAVYSASATEGGVSLCLCGDDGTETRVPDAAFDAVRPHPDRYEGGNVLASQRLVRDLSDQRLRSRVTPVTEAQVSSRFGAAGLLAALRWSEMDDREEARAWPRGPDALTGRPRWQQSRAPLLRTPATPSPRPRQRSSLRHRSRTPADAGKPTETEVARENIIHRQQLH